MAIAKFGNFFWKFFGENCWLVKGAPPAALPRGGYGSRGCGGKGGGFTPYLYCACASLSFSAGAKY
jgi:hypothetical protein